MGKAFGIEDNTLVWLFRHSGWLITRLHVHTDWLTPYQRLKRKQATSTGRSVELYRSLCRIPPGQGWMAEAMAKIKATPWQPKLTEPGEVKPRQRYISWAMLSLHGSSPNCRNCAEDGGAHSESCRFWFKKIWGKEEARERRALAGELARRQGGDGAAAGGVSTTARHLPASAPETTRAAASATQKSPPDAPMSPRRPWRNANRRATELRGREQE